MYNLGSTFSTIAVGRNLFYFTSKNSLFNIFHGTVAKILNSWLQRAVIFLRKRFPVALVLNDLKVWNWPNNMVSASSAPPPGLSVFVVVRNGFFKYCTRFVYLMQAMYLLFADLTQIVACDRELLLERRREILWKRKRMLLRALAWPPKMRIYCISSYLISLAAQAIYR